MASDRDDMNQALLAMRGGPAFSDFVKTLKARRESIVARLVALPGSDPNVEVLRGEARAYDYIISCTIPR